MTTRLQLTLFVPEPEAAELDAVRALLDPIQRSLIAPHVTLCREDEIEGLLAGVIEQRLRAAQASPLTLRFGAPEPFSSHGILLPCVAGEDQFRALRQRILGTSEVRRQAPHITLAHPRNPRAPGNSLANAAGISRGLSITFTGICRIQQQDSDPWQVLNNFSLNGTAPC